MSQLLANQTIDAAIAAILTAVPALILALAAYIKAKATGERQGAQIEGIQKQQDKQPVMVTPMATVATTPPTTLVSGGGVGPLTVPAWNQNNDVTTGGADLVTGAMNCGYECVAMCMRIMTGVQVPASYLRWLVKGPNDTSLATADDLVQAFALNEHQAHKRDAPFDALKVELAHAIAARKPAIVLGRWLSPEGHWMVCEQVDENRGILFRDPWGGPQYWLPWLVVQQRYAGTYVHVDERATYQP